MTVWHVLNSITADSYKPTEPAMDHMNQLLDYMNENPYSVIYCYTSERMFNFNLSTLYISVSDGRSQPGLCMELLSGPTEAKSCYSICCVSRTRCTIPELTGNKDTAINSTQ